MMYLPVTAWSILILPVSSALQMTVSLTVVVMSFHSELPSDPVKCTS